MGFGGGRSATSGHASPFQQLVRAQRRPPPDLAAGSSAALVVRMATPASISERIGAAINLVNSAADGAGDEEVTPSGIAEAIRDALEASPAATPPRVRKYLLEALDAVSDGMPADYVAMILYAALGVLRDG